MSDNPEIVEIVVVASRIYGANNFATFPSYRTYFNNLPNRDVPWVFSPYASSLDDYTQPDDPKRNLIDNIIYLYLSYYNSLANNISFIPDDFQVQIGADSFISGADFKAKFFSLRTVVTGYTYLPGYSGANYGDRFEINFKALSGYNRFGQEGINYLIFHEVAHNTLTGITTRSWMYNSYLDEVSAGTMAAGSYSGTNPYFIRQEGYTNYIAKQMADSLGISITPPNAAIDWPPNGYQGI